MILLLLGCAPPDSSDTALGPEVWSSLQSSRTTLCAHSTHGNVRCWQTESTTDRGALQRHDWTQECGYLAIDVPYPNQACALRSDGHVDCWLSTTEGTVLEWSQSGVDLQDFKACDDASFWGLRDGQILAPYDGAHWQETGISGVDWIECAPSQNAVYYPDPETGQVRFLEARRPEDGQGTLVDDGGRFMRQVSGNYGITVEGELRDMVGSEEFDWRRDWVQVASGWATDCAFNPDELYCWGATVPSRDPFGWRDTEGLIQIAPLDQGVCGLYASGEIRCDVREDWLGDGPSD